MRRDRRCIDILALIGGVVVFSACSARLERGELEVPAGSVSGGLAVEQEAENMKSGIGFGSFTVFAIPVKEITVEGKADEELMRVVKETVEHVGYQTVVVPASAEASGPAVCVCVNKFFFYNYTWFAPLVFNWGTVNLTVRVEDPQGTLLWSKDYKGDGIGLYDFNPTVNMAVNKVLSQLAVDLTSPDFTQAVFGAAAPAPDPVPNPE